MEFLQISESLRKIHINEGRNAALLGIDKGLNPHLWEPDKSNWDLGYVYGMKIRSMIGSDEDDEMQYGAFGQ
jgi:hypothetical protein